MCLLIFMNIHLISLFTIYIMKALKFDLYAALSSTLWCHKIVAKMLTKQSTLRLYFTVIFVDHFPPLFNVERNMRVDKCFKTAA